MKSGATEQGTYLNELVSKHLSTQNGKVVFKENHVVLGRQNIDSIKSKFIEALLNKLDERFPEEDTNILNAFSALGLRPISFLSKSERDDWGNDKIEFLIDQYGKEKTSTPTEDQPLVTVNPIINPSETRKEWAKVKDLVLNEGFHRDKLATLWSLIHKHYRDTFPNLLTLAALAMTAPIHTADCERGFSAQNAVKTPARNRLLTEKVDSLIMIKIEAGEMDSFDFVGALQCWHNSKQRKIFQKTYMLEPIIRNKIECH